LEGRRLVSVSVFDVVVVAVFKRDDKLQMDDMHPGVKQSTNAYMLVYIRDADLSSVLQDVTEDDIPRELLERLKEEKNLEILKRKERSEAHLFMQVTLMLEDAFVGHQGVDLYDPEKSSPAAIANSRVFKVPKKMKPKEFILHVGETMVSSGGGVFEKHKGNISESFRTISEHFCVAPAPVAVFDPREQGDPSGVH
jgi:hypothetical protein